MKERMISIANRAELRRQQHQKTPTYNLTSQQLKQYVKSEVKTITEVIENETIDTVLSVMAFSLNTEYGFGTKRISNLFADAIKRLNDVRDGTISLDDIKKWCEENNINI